MAKAYKSTQLLRLGSPLTAIVPQKLASPVLEMLKVLQGKDHLIRKETGVCAIANERLRISATTQVDEQLRSSSLTKNLMRVKQVTHNY